MDYEYKFHKYENKIKKLLNMRGGKIMDIGEIENGDETDVTFFSAMLKYLFNEKNSTITTGHIKNIQGHLKLNKCIYVIDFANIIGQITTIDEIRNKKKEIMYKLHNFVNMKIKAGHIVIIINKQYISANFENLFEDTTQYLKLELEDYLDKQLLILSIKIDKSCQESNSIDDLIFWLINIALFDIAYKFDKNKIKNLYFLTNDKQRMEKNILEYVTRNNCSYENFNMYTINSGNSKDNEKLFSTLLFRFIETGNNDNRKVLVTEDELRTSVQGIDYNDLNKNIGNIDTLQKPANVITGKTKITKKAKPVMKTQRTITPQTPQNLITLELMEQKNEDYRDLNSVYTWLLNRVASPITNKLHELLTRKYKDLKNKNDISQLMLQKQRDYKEASNIYALLQESDPQSPILDNIYRVLARNYQDINRLQQQLQQQNMTGGNKQEITSQLLLFYKYVYYIQYYIFGNEYSFTNTTLKKIIFEAEKMFNNNNANSNFTYEDTEIIKEITFRKEFGKQEVLSLNEMILQLEEMNKKLTNENIEIKETNEDLTDQNKMLTGLLELCEKDVTELNNVISNRK
jgi:hypothetical protein